MWKHSTFTISIFLSALIEQRIIFVTHCTLKRHRPLTSFLPSAQNCSTLEELTEMKTALKVINHLHSAGGFTPLSCKQKTFRSQKLSSHNIPDHFKKAIIPSFINISGCHFSSNIQVVKKYLFKVFKGQKPNIAIAFVFCNLHSSNISTL